MYTNISIVISNVIANGALALNQSTVQLNEWYVLNMLASHRTFPTISNRNVLFPTISNWNVLFPTISNRNVYCFAY